MRRRLRLWLFFSFLELLPGASFDKKRLYALGVLCAHAEPVKNTVFLVVANFVVINEVNVSKEFDVITVGGFPRVYHDEPETGLMYLSVACEFKFGGQNETPFYICLQNNYISVVGAGVKMVL